MTSRATLGLTAGALALGLLAGLALGGGTDKAAEVKGPGPTKTVAGVPVGYERSEPGAVRAALAYQAAIASMAHQKASGTAIIDAIAEPAARGSIAEVLSPGIALVQKSLGERGFIRSASVGYQVKSYDSDSAEIAIWGVSVLSQDGSPEPQSGWTTTKLRLKWAEGDWRLAAPPEGADGPSPALRDAPTDPTVVSDFVRQLHEVGYALAN